MGLNLQPHVVVIADDVADIGSSDALVLAVIQSNLYFEVHSVVAGVDICLKSTFVFHLGYGCAAKSSWLFIQKAVFAFETEHDGNNAKVFQLMADCRQR